MITVDKRMITYDHDSADESVTLTDYDPVNKKHGYDYASDYMIIMITTIMTKTMITTRVTSILLYWWTGFLISLSADDP